MVWNLHYWCTYPNDNQDLLTFLPEYRVLWLRIMTFFQMRHFTFVNQSKDITVVLGGQDRPMRAINTISVA